MLAYTFLIDCFECLFVYLILFLIFSYNFLPVRVCFVSSFQNPTPTAAPAPPAPESGVSVVLPVPPTANTGTNVSRSQGKVANVPANIQQNTHLANLLRQPVSDKNSRVFFKLTVSHFYFYWLSLLFFLLFSFYLSTFQSLPILSLSILVFFSAYIRLGCCG